MSEAAPGFGGVLETVLYYEPAQRARVERFYSEILGLRAVARWGDGTAYRVGAGVLLLFDTEKLGQRTEASLPSRREGRRPRLPDRGGGRVRGVEATPGRP